MIIEYIEVALQQAHYEIIKGDKPYYRKILDLPGGRATGVTLEECRKTWPMSLTTDL
ncbi:hypothetical protein [Methanofollis aquaemaris]|uniref:hypothetical protein n=1 Tax=Methanofollis aquaemaris TaxID=126734 RepID=UPI00223F9C1F|nr:hypothetical protein [Methanofollis aquaemaris]